MHQILVGVPGKMKDTEYWSDNEKNFYINQKEMAALWWPLTLFMPLVSLYAPEKIRKSLVFKEVQKETSVMKSVNKLCKKKYLEELIVYN